MAIPGAAAHHNAADPKFEVGLTFEDDPDKLESDLMSFNDEFSDYFSNRHLLESKKTAIEKTKLSSASDQLQSLPPDLLNSGGGRFKSKKNRPGSSREQVLTIHNFLSSVGVTCSIYEILPIVRGIRVFQLLS